MRGWLTALPSAEEIERARINSYSLVDQEASLGTRMVSVPIRRFDGKVVAALGFVVCP